MKNLTKLINTSKTILPFAFVLWFNTCMNNSKERILQNNSVDYDSIYEYLNENEARSLGELQKIYQQIDSINYDIKSLPPYHAGEEEEGAKIELRKLNKKADSIINSLSELGKKEAKTIYLEVFEN